MIKEELVSIMAGGLLTAKIPSSGLKVYISETASPHHTALNQWICTDWIHYYGRPLDEMEFHVEEVEIPPIKDNTSGY